MLRRTALTVLWIFGCRGPGEVPAKGAQGDVGGVPDPPPPWDPRTIVDEAIEFGRGETKTAEMLAWYVVDDDGVRVENALVWVEFPHAPEVAPPAEKPSAHQLWVESPQRGDKAWMLLISVRLPGQTWTVPERDRYHGSFPSGAGWYDAPPNAEELRTFLESRAVHWSFEKPLGGITGEGRSFERKVLECQIHARAWTARLGEAPTFQFER